MNEEMNDRQDVIMIMRNVAHTFANKHSEVAGT